MERITKCSVEGCEGLGDLKKNGTRVFKKGYCMKHYRRLHVHGDINYVEKIKGENRQSSNAYRIYYAMLRRCNVEKSSGYDKYGAKGITVDERWIGLYGFSNFIKDMGERPSKEYSLDRKDGNKGYSKDNCRWATQYEQSANRKSNTIYGAGISYIEKAKMFLITYSNKNFRYNKCCRSLEEAKIIRQQFIFQAQLF